LKNGKYLFTEAKIYKLTESSDTTPNFVLTSTWLRVTSNMKSTSHKTWQTSLIFRTSPNINLKRKSGGDKAYYIPRVPHQIAPMYETRGPYKHFKQLPG